MSLTNGAAHGSRVAGRGLYVASAGLMQGCGSKVKGAGFDVAARKLFCVKFRLEFEVND